MSFSKVQISNLCYLHIQNMRVEIAFNFSLCTISLLVILVIYFKRDTQNIIGRQVYQKIRSMLLLILEVGDNLS